MRKFSFESWAIIFGIRSNFTKKKDNKNKNKKVMGPVMPKFTDKNSWPNAFYFSAAVAKDSADLVAN